MRVLSFALALLVPAGFSLAAGPAKFLSPRDAAEVVSVDHVAVRDGSTVGRLVNHGTSPIGDIKVIVEHRFRWSNEYKPGNTSPGSAREFSVSGTLPTGGSLDFTLPSTPAATRKAGRFETVVRVVSFEELPARPRTVVQP